MILIRFGRWNGAHLRFLVWERIYHKGYIWTPFCRVSRRHGELWGQVGGDNSEIVRKAGLVILLLNLVLAVTLILLLGKMLGSLL